MYRKKFYWPALVALTAFFTVAGAMVAGADVLHGDDLNTGGDATKAAGATGTAEFWLTANAACNATTTDLVTVTVSSSDTSVVTIDSPGTLDLDSCGTAAAAGGTIGYSVSASATAGQTAIVSGVASGGTAGNDGFNNTPANFTVTVGTATPPSDTTAPTINCTVPDQTIWYGDNVTVNCTASDTGSGLANTSDASFSLLTNVADGSADSSALTGTHQVCDNATPANCATAGPYTFKVDREDPTAQFTNCPSSPLLLNSSASAHWTASDGSGSGLSTNASGDVTLDTSSVGSKSAFSPQPVDNVDNTGAAAECDYSVIYDWTGFFQPVDNNGVFNVAKAGSAIPVKFNLGGNQGLNIFQSGNPASKKIECTSSADLDTVETTVTAGGSSLTYDTTANQYVYVWKTDKAWAGTCRQFYFTLNDNTTHTANFKFTK